MHLAALFALAAIAIAAASPLSAQTSVLGTTDAAFLSTIDGVLSLKVDKARVATVADLTLQRDVGVLQFESGRLHLCTPVNGRTVAAVFVGTGTFRYRPPIDVERDQLKRFYQTEEITERFTSAVILFTDRTESELAARATFAPATPSDAAQSALDAFVGSIADRDRADIDPSFMRAVLNGGEDLFLAQIDGGERGRLYFEIDPFNQEEVGFMRRSRWSLDDAGRDDINRHHLQDEYLSGTDGDETVADFSFTSYRIASTIDKDLKFTSDYDLGITMLRDSVRWSYFYLMSEMAIDRLEWSNGEHADHYRAPGSALVWVRNSKSLRKGESATLKLVAHGEPLGRIYNTVYLKESSMWYPRHDFKQRAPFDMTFTTPEQFLFAAAGHPVKEAFSNGDGTVSSRWVLEEPSRNVSFNIGYFYETKVTPDSLPPIVVLRDKEMAQNVATQVAWDVEHSIKFFQHLFGPARAPYFSATQIPFGHGEAFPGLIHLSWLTFEGNLADDIERANEVKREGFNEFFRAHEVAHQWWGIGVDFTSYHDQWLSEGFASYSGLMYVQAALKDNEMFFDWLRYYRDEILDNRNSIFGKGQEAGPIWLGHRTSTSTTAGDYNLIIYKKGAWVLHMIRVLMIDPNTLSDEKFRTMMREFYTTYVGKHASTQDFQRIVEKHAGTKMDWFFQQWVYGTAIPSYRFAYKVSEMPDGKYLLKCRVDQSDVPAEFRAYPMVSIDFGDNRLLRGRRPVSGPRTEFELVLPAKPKDVIFNDFESVLCTVEEVDWK
jgi:hypothetical protein